MTSPRGEPNERLVEGPSDLTAVVAFGAELTSYARLWRWLSIADMAHVRGLAGAEAITPEIEQELLRELLSTHSLDMPLLDPGKGDLYSNRFAHLRTTIGPVVDHIHTGRARREATTIAWHLETRSRIEAAIASVARLVGALLSVAESHSTTLMSDFTYLQHAHPTTLGHYLLGFAYPLTRDLRRLTAALESMNRSPAGSGSVNGSRIPIDRVKLAEDLEFDGLLTHNRDAMWAPDVALDPMWAIMSAMITIDRLSEELQLWATAEFGYFEPADRHSRTSVIMPQKKNPYGLAMIRGHARDQVGHLISVVTTNLTPTGQPDNRIRAYGEVPASLERLEGAAGLLAEHLELGEFDTVALAKSAGSDFTTATEICDWMTFEHGVGNRDAHTVVGKAVRHAIERGGDSLTVEDIQEAASELEVELPSIEPGVLDSLQDPMTTLEHRTGLGSVTDLERMIQELARELDTLPSSRFADFEQRYLDSIARALDERNAT